jgi:hypothetical protein
MPETVSDLFNLEVLCPYYKIDTFLENDVLSLIFSENYNFQTNKNIIYYFKIKTKIDDPKILILQKIKNQKIQIHQGFLIRTDIGYFCLNQDKSYDPLKKDDSENNLNKRESFFNNFNYSLSLKKEFKINFNLMTHSGNEPFSSKLILIKAVKHLQAKKISDCILWGQALLYDQNRFLIYKVNHRFHLLEF